MFMYKVLDIKYMLCWIDFSSVSDISIIRECVLLSTQVTHPDSLTTICAFNIYKYNIYVSLTHISLVCETLYLHYLHTQIHITCKS